jgi:FkbM family methyltransferase
MSDGYSQFGEHADIDEIVADIQQGFACDVGAYDGRTLSNTLHLEERGWNVLCIEPNPLCAGFLTMNRKLVKMVACGKEDSDSQPFTVVETNVPRNYAAASALVLSEDRPKHPEEKIIGTFDVPVRTLNSLLRQVGFPRLDVLNIDVEGGEADVLTGFDIAWWSPKVIVLEDWKGGRFRDKMRVHGYHLYRKRDVNEIYRRV